MKRNLLYFLVGFSFLVALFIFVGPQLNLLLRFSADAFTEVANDVSFYMSLIRSLALSFLSTVVLGFVSLPLIFVMARKRFWGRGLLWAFFQTPAFIPHIASGIALLGYFSANGMLGTTLIPFGKFVVNTPLGIMLAMAFVSFPHFFNTMLTAFESVPEEIEWLALTAGVSRVEILYKIILPATKSHLFYAMTNMFSRGASEFGAVLLLAYYPKTFPVYLYDLFLTKGLAQALVALGMVIFALLILFSVIFGLTQSKK